MLSRLKPLNEMYVLIGEYNTKSVCSTQLLEYNKKIVCTVHIE